MVLRAAAKRSLGETVRDLLGDRLGDRGSEAGRTGHLLGELGHLLVGEVDGLEVGDLGVDRLDGGAGVAEVGVGVARLVGALVRPRRYRALSMDLGELLGLAGG